jgi:hypothetical protein
MKGRDRRKRAKAKREVNRNENRVTRLAPEGMPQPVVKLGRHEVAA